MTSIAFQGQPGAYSDLACRIALSGLPTLPCETFEAAIDAVREGRAELAMLPPENSLAGRVADMHALLPESGLSIIGEKFLRVEHCLLAPPGANLGQHQAHPFPSRRAGPGPQSAPRAGGTPWWNTTPQVRPKSSRN